MSGRELNAYRHPQLVRPGCTHQLGCRCDPPFWLRPSSPAEEAIADRIYGLTPQVDANAAVD